MGYRQRLCGWHGTPIFLRRSGVLRGVLLTALSTALVALGSYPAQASGGLAGQTQGFLPQARLQSGMDEMHPFGISAAGLTPGQGTHILAEPRFRDVYARRMDALWPEVRDLLVGMRERVGTVRRVPAAPGEMKIEIGKRGGEGQAIDVLRGMAQGSVGVPGFDVSSANGIIAISLTGAARKSIDSSVMTQEMTALHRRLEMAGLADAWIDRVAPDRIAINVPGYGSPEAISILLGQPARLSVDQVVGRTKQSNTDPGAGNRLLPASDGSGYFFILGDEPVIPAAHVQGARAAFGPDGYPGVYVSYDKAGIKIFNRYVQSHRGQPYAVVVDGGVVSVQVLREDLPGTGLFVGGGLTVESAANLALLLRSGALPAGLHIIEAYETTVAARPTLQTGETAVSSQTAEAQKQKLAAMQLQIGNLTADLAAKNAKIAQDRRQIDGLGSQLNAALAQIAVKDREIAKLEPQVKSVPALDNNNNAMAATLSALQKVADASDEKVKVLQGRLNKCLAKLTARP